MSHFRREVERGIAQLRAFLEAIRNCRITGDITQDPGWCALVELPGTHNLLLTNLGEWIREVCNKVDPKAAQDHFARSIDQDTEHDYWIGEPIAAGVTDLAVDLGVLSQGDVERLRAVREWDKPIADVCATLEADDQFLSAIADRLRELCKDSELRDGWEDIFLG